MAALSGLILSFVEANDNKSLIISDITGTGDSTDWGTGTVGGVTVSYSTIDGSAATYGLELDIEITTSDGTVTAYDTIDLYTEFGNPGFTTMDDMVFTIDSTLLKVSGVAIGDATDELPDGTWDITYTLVDVVTPANNVVYDKVVLIYGVVEKAVYEKLRAIISKYDNSEWLDDHLTREAMFAYSYLIAIEASAETAKEEELLNSLSVLERLITHDSNNTW